MTKVCLTLASSLFMLMVSCSSARAQELETKLARRVTAFDSESSSTLGQLTDFARKFQIPMGIEWQDKSEGGLTPPIHARNTTAQHILGQILQAEPGNRYRVREGIVHVFALPILNDSRNFLNLRIPTFQVENESLFGAEFLLRVSIHRVLNPSQGYGGGHGHGVPRNDMFDVRNLSFAFTGATVRQILDGIVARQGNALWVVRMNPSRLMDNGRFYVQLASPTGKEPAPDFYWQFIPLSYD